MNKKVVTLILASSLILTGCGSGSSRAYKGDSVNMTSAGFASNDVEYEDAYYDSMDYSDTNISGDKADYSYAFRASGKTSKSKDEMLADYESVQQFVDSEDGYIEDVYNDYSYYPLSEATYGNSIRYKTSGRLSFTVQIDNEKVPEVIELLDQICKTNNLKVTNYSQKIINYKNWNIVDEDDYEYYEYYNKKISQDELESRIKYASISVDLEYNMPRAGITKFGIHIRNAFIDIVDSFGDIIKSLLVIVVILIVLFIQLIIFYKCFRKMMYKHRIKNPEYYMPREITLTNYKEAINKEVDEILKKENHINIDKENINE